MRLVIATSVLAAVVLVVTSHRAEAQCPFPHPVKAKKFSSALVQAFVPCDMANTMTESGVPSCSPAETYAEFTGTQPTSWFWGPKSSGSVTLTTKGTDMQLAASLADIHDLVGRVTATGKLSFVVRATIYDPPPGTMTVIDVPFTVPFPLVEGKGKVKTMLSALAAPYDQFAGVLTGPCTSVELIAPAQVIDPTGTTFAVPGFFLP